MPDYFNAFNVLECGRNILDRLDVSYERACMEIQSIISDSAHSNSEEQVDAISDSRELVDGISNSNELVDAVSKTKAIVQGLNF